jgi:hypothetical protein
VRPTAKPSCVTATGSRSGWFEVPVADRAPILRRYLAVAPGARAHFPVDSRQPLAQFERIAADYPVFRITASPHQ